MDLRLAFYRPFSVGEDNQILMAPWSRSVATALLSQGNQMRFPQPSATRNIKEKGTTGARCVTCRGFAGYSQDHIPYMGTLLSLSHGKLLYWSDIGLDRWSVSPLLLLDRFCSCRPHSRARKSKAESRSHPRCAQTSIMQRSSREYS